MDYFLPTNVGHVKQSFPAVNPKYILPPLSFFLIIVPPSQCMGMVHVWQNAAKNHACRDGEPHLTDTVPTTPAREAASDTHTDGLQLYL